MKVVQKRLYTIQHVKNSFPHRLTSGELLLNTESVPSGEIPFPDPQSLKTILEYKFALGWRQKWELRGSIHHPVDFQGFTGVGLFPIITLEEVLQLASRGRPAGETVVSEILASFGIKHRIRVSREQFPYFTPGVVFRGEQDSGRVAHGKRSAADGRLFGRNVIQNRVDQLPPLSTV